MAVNNPNSPRQKMINVMYLVFIAMLALNVSPQVLDGFQVIDNSLRSSSAVLLKHNLLITNELQAYRNQNPQKAEEWYKKGLRVRSMSDSLINYVENLKIRMARKADGKKANVNAIKHKEDLNAASEIMLSPINGEAKKLHSAIANYRNIVSQMILNPNNKTIKENTPALHALGQTLKQPLNGTQWFLEQIPVSAAITLLSKLQNDIRSSEGEVLTNLLNSVDAGDFRVNRINAYVIPESNIIMQGGSYNARIVLSAEDSTKHPSFFVNDNTVKDGQITFPANSIGTHSVEGYAEIPRADGSVLQRKFSSNYTVIEPTATIAPTLMNVLYAGIDNEISISVPGLAPQNITASITNGSLTRKGNMWTAKPSKAGMNAVISITANTGGQSRQLTKKEFRVRSLPDPAPYIEYSDANGNLVMFKGGNLKKGALVNASGIKAAIDDGILNIPFRVKSFRTVFFDAMGNAIPEISDGSSFSRRQKAQIKRLSRGKFFYISGVKAIGPDGSEREIAVIEVRVN